DLQYCCPAVRSVLSGVALAGHRPVQLADSSGVVDGLVDLDAASGEALPERLEHALEELAVVGGQIDAVEQVVAGAGIRVDGRRPALPAEVLADCQHYRLRHGFFRVGGGHAGGGCAVDVDEEPAAALDVAVLGELAVLGDVDAVGPARQDSGLQRVQGEIHSAGAAGQLEGRLGRLLPMVRVVVAGDRPRPAVTLRDFKGAHLENLTGLEEQGQTFDDLLEVRVRGGHTGRGEPPSPAPPARRVLVGAIGGGYGHMITSG